MTQFVWTGAKFTGQHVRVIGEKPNGRLLVEFHDGRRTTATRNEIAMLPDDRSQWPVCRCLQCQLLVN